MTRNAWTEADFRRNITKAQRVIRCSWGVAGLRDRKTGERETVLVFHDDDKGEFAHAFAFPSLEEVEFLCRDLLEMAGKIEKQRLEDGGK